MKSLLLVLGCIGIPMIPVLIDLWLTRNDKVEEEYIPDYY